MYLVTQLCSTIVTPKTVAWQAPLSMGFFRQESWSGLPFPSPGDLPNPEIEPRSPALQADSLLTELRGQFLCKNQILEPPEDVTETAVGITLGLAVTHLFWFLLAFGKHHIVHLINPCTSDLSSMPQRELLRACILPEIALACTHTFKSLE